MRDPAVGDQDARHRGPTDAAEAHLDLVLSEARQRFTAAFADECDGLSRPADQAGADPTSLLDAVKVLRRMAGVGGTLGFPRVSATAAALAEALTTGALNRAALAHRVPGLRAAFAVDIQHPHVEAPDVERLDTPLTVLLVEDEPAQRTIISAQLRGLGHVAVAVASGEEALEAARRARPDVILLDIELPGIDGYAVCQMLKADSDLASIPVAFLSVHGTVDDRLTGLSVGADDFLVKPVDRRELSLRLTHLQGLRHRSGPPDAGGILSYDAFQRDASSLFQRGRCALALIRIPVDQAFDVAVFTRDQIRRGDLCARYDRSHVVLLLPDVGRVAATDRIAALVESCRARGGDGIRAGVAASQTGGAQTLEQLVEEADEALTIARDEDLAAAARPDERGEAATSASIEPLILVADDDPNVVRVVDGHLATAGYRRILAFEGKHALELIQTHHPQIAVFDLMLPRLTGFDVLAALRDMSDRRPRVIALSARGREESVMRAFSLGVDDFMLKPFNPQELLVRIARLIKGSARSPRLRRVARDRRPERQSA